MAKNVNIAETFLEAASGQADKAGIIVTKIWVCVKHEQQFELNVAIQADERGGVGVWRVGTSICRIRSDNKPIVSADVRDNGTVIALEDPREATALASCP